MINQNAELVKIAAAKIIIKEAMGWPGMLAMFAASLLLPTMMGRGQSQGQDFGGQMEWISQMAAEKEAIRAERLAEIQEASPYYANPFFKDLPDVPKTE